jgi:putative FmdB family regulatory protein
MPLYEYKCERCGETFEILQKFSDQPLTTHEGCGGAVERLISTSALQFKGSGWYVTDYAKSGSGSASKNGKDGGESKSESSSKSDSGKSEGSKSDGGKTASSAPPAPAASTPKTDSKLKSG